MFKKNILLLMALACACTTAQARPLSAIKASGVINLGADPTYVPFFYQENKENKGFEYELGNEIARRLGVKPVWKLMPYDKLWDKVDDGSIDLNIASNSIYPDALKDFSFTQPHYCSGAVILSLMSNPVSLNKISGAKTSFASDTSHREIINKLVESNKRLKFTTDTDAISTLVFGKAQAYIGDKFVALDAMRRFPSIKFQMTSVLAGSEDTLGMMTQKGNTTLTTAVNKILQDMLKDGTYKKISLKYFGKDIRCEK